MILDRILSWSLMERITSTCLLVWEFFWLADTILAGFEMGTYIYCWVGIFLFGRFWLGHTFLVGFGVGISGNPWWLASISNDMLVLSSSVSISVESWESSMNVSSAAFISNGDGSCNKQSECHYSQKLKSDMIPIKLIKSTTNIKNLHYNREVGMKLLVNTQISPPIKPTL